MKKEESALIQDAFEMAGSAIGSIRAVFPAAYDLPPARRWHYHQGVFLLGVLRYWEETEDESLIAYIEEYADFLIAEDGYIDLAATELDAMQAGVLLFPLLKRTGKEKYRKGLDYIISLLDGFHKTPEGGFWHKDKYPDQQWLDGLYMAGPVSVRYAGETGRKDLFDLFTRQAKLIYNRTKDPDTGLLRHGFDYSRKASWADRESGQAPECWGRALGWFPAAILDMLDVFPREYPGYGELERIFLDLIPPIVRFQDPGSGLWYQVIDRGDDPRNWSETSCSALFLYSLAKGIRTGRLGPEYAGHLIRGLRGIMGKTSRDENGYLHVNDICIGTGIGDYQFYLDRPRSTDDLHGVGAFVLACVEAEKLRASQDPD